MKETCWGRTPQLLIENNLERRVHTSLFKSLEGRNTNRPKQGNVELRLVLPSPVTPLCLVVYCGVLDQQDTSRTVGTATAKHSVTSQQQSVRLNFEFPCFCCSLSQTSCCLNCSYFRMWIAGRVLKLRLSEA